MIAELFYPKELKEVIKDLREKDDLNEEALENIQNCASYRKLYLFIIGCFFLSIAIFFIEKVTLLSAGFFLFSSVFMFWTFAPITLANHFIMPYACGEKTIGKITNTYYQFIPFDADAGWVITYEFWDLQKNKQKGVQNRISRSDAKNKEIINGDEIEIYYLPSTPKKNVPFLPSIYEKYSLRKVKENTYE